MPDLMNELEHSRHFLTENVTTLRSATLQFFKTTWRRSYIFEMTRKLEIPKSIQSPGPQINFHSHFATAKQQVRRVWFYKQ